MPRRGQRESAFHRKHWASWFAKVCDSIGATNSAIARALAKQQHKTDDEFAGLGATRIRSWRNGESNVEPETAFRVGQKLSRLYNRLDFAGPFAVIGAGYLADALDILRRVEASTATICYEIAVSGMQIPLKFDDSEDERYIAWLEETINLDRQPERYIEEFDAAWNDVLNPRGAVKKWLLGYEKDADGYIVPSMVDVTVAKEIVRAGEHRSEIPMVRRFYHAEALIDNINFLSRTFGPEYAYDEGIQMIDAWLQRYDRQSISDDKDLEAIKILLNRYSRLLEELALQELQPILDKHGAPVIDRDYPFNFEDNQFWSPENFDAGFDFKSRRVFASLLEDMWLEAKAIQADMDELSSKKWFVLPSSRHRRMDAPPYISAITAAFRAQLKGGSKFP